MQLLHLVVFLAVVVAAVVVVNVHDDDRELA